MRQIMLDLMILEGEKILEGEMMEVEMEVVMAEVVMV
jgi:hypothetical protein